MASEADGTPALPHSCGGCDSRWGGANTSHCGSCHRSYSSVGTFDLHRKGGTCLLPEEAGLILIGGRPYECWGREWTGERPV